VSAVGANGFGNYGVGSQRFPDAVERNILCRRGVDQSLDLRLVLVHRRTLLNADQ
jgi:hypothetical protein